MSVSDGAQLNVPCSHCGAPVTADLRYCPACGGALVVGPDDDRVAPAPEPVEDESWRPQGRQWAILAAAGLALLVFAAAIVIDASGDAEPDPNQALTRPRLGAALGERFVIADWRPVDGVLGVVIRGEVRNENAVAAGVELQIISYGADGNVIDTHEYWPAGRRNIEPGAAASIDVLATDKHAVTFELRVINARVW